MTKLKIFILLFVASGCGSIQFEQQSLYDRYEEISIKEKGPMVIYQDAAGTMWNELAECGDFEITNEVSAFSGNNCIKIEWNKGRGCEWAGFGNSFNNWNPIDLSEARHKKALSFYVRSIGSDTVKSIPIVANLEDFGGGGSYYFIDANKYLNGLQIDSTWKQIIVPLWDFPVNEEEVDIYSIKQMKFQLEGAGAFYLDEISIIDYSKEQYNQMRENVELMKPKGNVNQTIYRKNRFLNDAWGYENNDCQDLKEVEKEGNKVIYWKYKADCSWSQWGINWNDWYQINLRGVIDQAKISFRVKAGKGSQFQISLEDYRGHSVKVYEGKETNGWQEVEIPLSKINITQSGLVLDQIKQLKFQGSSDGEVYFDNIKITKK